MSHISPLLVTLIIFCSRNPQAHQIISIDLEIELNTSEELRRLAMIVPGTKWCGPGNMSKGYEDLGILLEVDKCCRAHDSCDNIPSFETKYGLTNHHLITVLDCECDELFYKCLQATKDVVGKLIGSTYFLIQNRCYREDYPIKACLEYDKSDPILDMVSARCIKYDFDATKPKQYQWFDLPYYKKNDVKSIQGHNSEKNDENFQDGENML